MPLGRRVGPRVYLKGGCLARGAGSQPAGLRAGAVAIGVGSPQAPWPQPPSQPPEAGGRPHRNTCGCKLGADAEGWDRRRARVADCRARNGHFSDVPPSPSSCVCTTRLPLKMRARPATSGLKDAPGGEVYGVHGAAAWGCGSHLSNEPSVRKAARCSVTHGAGCGTGRRGAEVCSWGGNQLPKRLRQCRHIDALVKIYK